MLWFFKNLFSLQTPFEQNVYVWIRVNVSKSKTYLLTLIEKIESEFVNIVRMDLLNLKKKTKQTNKQTKNKNKTNKTKTKTKQKTKNKNKNKQTNNSHSDLTFTLQTASVQCQLGKLKWLIVTI